MRALLVAGLVLLATEARAEWELDEIVVVQYGTLLGDSVAVADVGGDGRTDVVATVGVSSGPGTALNQLAVFRQQPNGELEVVLFPLGMSSFSTRIDVGDLNGDERRDILVGGNSTTVVHLAGDPLLAPVMVASPTPAVALDIADRGPDGVRDAIVDGQHILQNSGGGAFMLELAALDAIMGQVLDQAVCDFDGNGLRDVVVLTAERELRFHRFQPDGTYAPVEVLLTPGAPTRMECGDVTRDGFADVVVAQEDLSFAYFYGGPSFGMFGQLGVKQPIAELAIGGLDGLGDEGSGSLVVMYASGDLSVFELDESAPVSELPLPGSVAPTGSIDGLAIGDINGDRCGDIVVAARDFTLGLYYGTGCPDDVDPIDAGVPTVDAGLAFCELDPGGPDLDGDGVVDACDLCPSVFDPIQVDFDLDGLGDSCDPCASGECACTCEVGARQKAGFGGGWAIGVIALCCLGGLRRLRSRRR